MQQPVFIQLPSAPMQAIYKTIQKVGKVNIPFLITGETGVGKEIIARYIHEKGPRHDQPFIAINCGRFSVEFLQSELFGYEAGAFTNALFQRARKENTPLTIVGRDILPSCAETKTRVLKRKN